MPERWHKNDESETPVILNSVKNLMGTWVRSDPNAQDDTTDHSDFHIIKYTTSSNNKIRCLPLTFD